MSDHGTYVDRGFSFDAANEHRKEVKLWNAEIDTLRSDLKSKEKIEARIYELYRNDDLFRGLIEKLVDTRVGSRVILQCNPDMGGLDVPPEEIREWCRVVEREFHRYADSPENWISADRSMDFTQLCRSAERQYIMTGETIASREWRRSPLGYSTCVNLISSNRLKTPKAKAAKVFHGIEMDRYGAATAYHIEVHDPIKEQSGNGDIDKPYVAIGSKGSRSIKRFSRYNSFNWLQLWHIYEPLKPEYPRGISRIAASLIKSKQLSRFHEADLEKAIIATSYVYAIKSDATPEEVADALSGVDAYNDDLGFGGMGEDVTIPKHIQANRNEIIEGFRKRYETTLTGGQIMHLFKDEDVELLSAPNTIQTSEGFSKGHKRSIANGMGISYELGTGDLEGVSFSGGQMSLGIYENSANVHRQLYTYKFPKLVFRSWLDEAMDKAQKGDGPLKLLGNIPYFANRERYSRCTFSGARRVHLDPVKLENSNSKGLANLTKSRIQITSDEGFDFELLAKQRGDEARIILQAVEDICKSCTIELTDDVKRKIVIDIIAGNGVESASDLMGQISNAVTDNLEQNEA